VCGLLAVVPARAATADPSVEPVEWLALAHPIGLGADAPHRAAAWVTARLQRDALLPATDSLGVSRTLRSAEGTRVVLSQWTPGGRIEGVGCTAWIGADGVLQSTIGCVVQEPVPPPPPQASLPPAEGERVWLVGEDGSRWAMLERRTHADRPPLRRWRDVATGALLREDRGVAHAPGRAFERDGASDVIDVTLAGLPMGATRLSGERVGVDEPLRGPIEALSGDFRFEPHGADSAAFDHVNAYWHVDRFLGEELAAMGGLLPSESLIVQVRMPIAPQVALTSGRYILLGHPIPGYARESWRAGDLMRHETVHALLFDLGVDGTGADREAIALHEGLADYLAAAATGDPAFGEWLYVQHPSGVTRVDQPAAEFCYEHFDEVRAGGVATGSAWANGMILSGALWDLRQAIGDAADSLVLGGMRRLPPSPRWRDLAAAMLAADWHQHDGRHAWAIVAAFAGRGIVARTGVEIAGPLMAELGGSVSYRAVRRYPDAAAETRWFTRAWCGEVPCAAPFLAAGSGPVLTSPVAGEFEVLVQSIGADGHLVTSQRFVPIAPPQFIDGPRIAARGDTVEYSARSRRGALESVRWMLGDPRHGAAVFQVVTARTLQFVAWEPFRLEVAMPGAWRQASAIGIDVPVVAVVDAVDAPSVDRLLAVRSGRESLDCRFVLGAAAHDVVLEWFDVAGRRWQSSHCGALAAGEHTRRIDARAAPAGLYLVRLRTERARQVVRVVRLR